MRSLTHGPAVAGAPLQLDEPPVAGGSVAWAGPALNEPFLIADVAVDSGASIGIAMDSPTMETVDDLLGDADIAMYRAKAQGKGRYHVFREADPDARAARDQTWVERSPTVRRRDPLRLVEPRLQPRAG
ncbi:MAG: diguanylate cyclase [Chloroflexota bacterium]